MTKFAFPLLALLLSLGLAGGAYAQEYEAEGGINWFGETGRESFGTFEDAGDDYRYWDYESDVLDDDYGYGYEAGISEDEDTFEEDDFGVFDSDYSWETDDEWFDGWFGDSDELF